MDARFLFFLGFIFTLSFTLSFILALNLPADHLVAPARNRLPLINAVIVDRGKP